MAEAPQTILIVDDMALNRHLLTRLLSKDYAVLEADSGEAALDMALSHRPDLILLDVMLPKMDGYQVLSHLKSDMRTASIAVIFLSGLDTPEDEERGLLIGASDYITKPFNGAVVRARVALHLQLARQRRMLETLANVDGLTEISNRRCFDEKLHAELSRAGRSGQPLSLALLDVDSFKPYNDHYGHGMGDRVLRAVALVLHEGLKRPGDLAARYGGEEFVLMMPDTPAAGALYVTERVRQAVAALGIPHQYSAAAPYVTVSAGVATTAGLYPLPPAEALLEQADARLYQAKAGGRNRVVGA